MGSLSGTNGKEQRKKGTKNEQAFRFINHTLTTAQRDDLRAMDVGTEFPAEMVDELVVEGYKYSLSLDRGNQTFVASLTDRDEQSPFYNACLTGRGSTPANARAALLYRHVVVAQLDWSNFGEVGSVHTSDFD